MNSIKETRIAVPVGEAKVVTVPDSTGKPIMTNIHNYFHLTISSINISN
jgi:hypothetical protein